MGARRMLTGVVAGAVGVLGLLPAAAAAQTDTTPPVLQSLAFSSEAAHPGQGVTVTVRATDDAGLATIRVALVEVTSGSLVELDSTATTPTSEFRVTTGSANGRWTARHVILRDEAGNQAVYGADGGLTTQPPTTDRHTVDLSSPGVTVSGASDLSPPVLDEFTVLSVPRRAGEAVTYSWRAHDVGSGVASVRTTFGGVDSGYQFNSYGGPHPSTGGVGSGSTVLATAGGQVISSVMVTDDRGNSAVYARSGHVTLPGPVGASHDLPLDEVSFSVAAGSPSFGLVERPARLTVLLDTRPAAAQQITGYRITTRPAGRVTTVSPSPTPGRGSTLQVDLADLPNGVEQAVSVTSLSPRGDGLPTTWRARPSLARPVAAAPDAPASPRTNLFVQRQWGTTSNTDVHAYVADGRGSLRGPTLIRPGDPDTEGCQALVPFVAAGSGDALPLCQRDDLAPVLHAGNQQPVYGVRGWSSLRFVDGGRDLNGDATADVIAVDPAGTLRLYAQTSRSTLVAAPRIGTGWGSMISVVSAGDLTGDRKNDIVAVDASGRLWLYPGNGKGGVTARRQIGSGWHRMAALLPLRDFDGDGRADLGGITPTGDLMLYRGTGTGGVRTAVRIGTGWDLYL